MNEIELKAIVSNGDNTREPAPNLQGQGYPILDSVDGSGKPPLFALALGTPEDKRLFCKLIEEYEEALTDLAQSMAQRGQLQNCRVRAVGDGKYALTFGARRCLAVLYSHAKHGKPATVWATVSEADDETALVESAAENANRLPPSYLDQARLFQRFKDQGMTVKQIAHVFPMGKATEQNIRHRLKLLELPEAIQLKVHHGKLSQDAALKLLKKAGGGTSKPAKKPKVGESQAEGEPQNGPRPGEGELEAEGKPKPKVPVQHEGGEVAREGDLQTALEEFIDRLSALDLRTLSPADPDELLRLVEEARRLLCDIEAKASEGTLALVG